MTKLDEMWAALSAYQPQADAAGHGDTWARMCSDKTTDAAYAAHIDADAAVYATHAADAAYSAGASSASSAAYAAYAAYDAVYAARRAQEAIDAIAKAEGEQK